MTALTLYPTSTIATTVATDNTLTTTAPGTETSANSRIGNVSTPTFWALLASQSYTTANNTVSEQSPSTGGWLWDVATLEGQQLLAGSYSFKTGLQTNTAGATCTADIHCRLYKRSSSGTFTLILDAVLTAQTINHSGAYYTVSGSTASATTFSTGDKLYYDQQVSITAYSTFGSNTSIATFFNLSTAEFITTPGYSGSSTTVTKTAQTRLVMRVTATKIAQTRFVERVVQTLSAQARFVEQVTKTASAPVRFVARVARSVSSQIRLPLRVQRTLVAPLRFAQRNTTTTLAQILFELQGRVVARAQVKLSMRTMFTRVASLRAGLSVGVSRSAAVRALVRSTVTKTGPVLFIQRQANTASASLLTRLVVGRSLVASLRVLVRSSTSQLAQVRFPLQGISTSLLTTLLPDPPRIPFRGFGILPVPFALAAIFPYQVNGAALDSQPYISTAPHGTSGMVHAGTLFTLHFQNPGPVTTGLFASGTIASLQFAMPDGFACVGQVQITSTTVGSLFHVQCVLLADMTLYRWVIQVQAS